MIVISITVQPAVKRSTFSLAKHKSYFLELVNKTDQKTIAVWAIACAERVLPYFEENFPEDPRPRQEIETLQAWIRTGVFKMAVTGTASLSSHAAARDVAEDNAARSAARSAAGHPALSVPGGFTAAGLLVSVQIVGRHHGDWGVLQLGFAFEPATQCSKHHPAIAI